MTSFAIDIQSFGGYCDYMRNTHILLVDLCRFESYYRVQLDAALKVTSWMRISYFRE